MEKKVMAVKTDVIVLALVSFIFNIAALLIIWTVVLNMTTNLKTFMQTSLLTWNNKNNILTGLSRCKRR